MAKRTLPLFYKIFFSVLMLAVCAVGVGLWMLNGVLEEYESVQPKNVADEIFAKYYASHDFDTLAAKCATENPFASAADVASYMHEKYDGAEMTCTSGAAQGEAPTYIVKVNDYKISSFTLKESAERSKHGWVKYEEGDFVLYYDTAEVTVTAPETYKVFVNSVELGEAQVTQKDIPGEGDELLPQGVEGVKYTQYTVKGLIKTPEITSESPDGLASEVKYVESEKMYRVSPLFDDALMAEHKDYVLKAAEEYSKYMENDSWWGGISQYFDPFERNLRKRAHLAHDVRYRPQRIPLRRCVRRRILRLQRRRILMPRILHPCAHRRRAGIQGLFRFNDILPPRGRHVQDLRNDKQRIKAKEMLAAITGADLAILDFIYDNLHCAFLDAVMPVITALGNGGILFIAIAVVMLFFKRTRKTGLMIGCALILGLLVCNLTLKPLVARERPFTHRAVELLVSRPKDFSFPSGHTIASFEFATVLFLRERKAGIIALVAAVLISFSRMYLYLHFPSDVFTSVVLGILFGILGVVIVNALWKRFAGDEKKAEL